MYVTDKKYKLEYCLPLVKFSYNNNYHRSLGMAPYERLYGRPCKTPLIWDRLEDRNSVGPEMLQEMEEKVCNIRQRLKDAHDKQKSYVDMHRLDRIFKEEFVFLRVKPQKISIKFGKGSNLSP